MNSIKLCWLLFALIPFFGVSQNITVDSETFTPQQLIEDILIDSDCIQNVTVTNVVGGNFNNTDQSFGFFDATGTTFPFQSGIVMSTGGLQNVPGPNTSLSDDDAQDWFGDADLETALNETNTLNATILEFDFTSIAPQISFRYLFASEEYQEGNSNTCRFSDLFGFLIRPANSQEQYTNIALVPGTQTPVKVTTVHSGIPGSCDPINETYFGSWNDANVPINFNGQTEVLTAVANVIPNTSYHVKLVIADEENHRFDSAVFLEASSFQLSSDLGPDRLLATNNALCEGESLTLSASQQSVDEGYIWYKDGIPQNLSPCLVCNEFIVTEAGTYDLEVYLAGDCISNGTIVIEYAELPEVQNASLQQCDINTDGLSTFNLFNAEDDILQDTTSAIAGFYLSESDAEANIPIQNPDEFQNTVPNQIIYVLVTNTANCSAIAEIMLQTSNNPLNIQNLGACDGEIIDGFGIFDLPQIKSSIINQIPTGAIVTYFKTEEDALLDNNPLSLSYENEEINTQTIFVKVIQNGSCYALSTAILNVLYTPVLKEDETFIYCLNRFPATLTLFGGVLNDSPNNYLYQWVYNGTTIADTSFIEVNQTGTYSVTVTDPNGCASTRTITINPSNTATIERISVEGISPINTITATVSGEGNYEFALDDSNGPYQQSIIFLNVPEGFHTMYVRDTNRCGTVEQIFSVLGFPKFFTPNNDTVNDTWIIKGSNAQFNTVSSIQIFNRYGKLVDAQGLENRGWNGTLNGKNLPTDDYWYVVTFIDGRSYKGHFTLKR